MRRATVLLVLLLGACGSRGGEPGDLIGTWSSQTPGVTLDIGAHSYRLASGNLIKWGTVERTPFRVAFVLERTSTPAFDRYCRERVNVYDWRLEEGGLSFRAVGRPCDRGARTVLVAGDWRKVEG